MFPCSYLPVVFLLAAVVKGMTTTDPITHNFTSDGGMINETSTTPATSHVSGTESSNSRSNHSTSSFPTLPPSTTEHLTASVATTTVDNATAESTTTKPSTTQSETTFSQPTPESRTTTAAVNSPVTENSNLTTGSPDVSPSAPTSGTTVSTAIQETSRPTNTMSGNITASSTTTPTSTTITTGTAITGTTQRPTDVTTNNSTTTTISTGTTITSTTQQPTDVTTNNSSSTTPTSTTTISTGTTITSTTQQPTDVPTTNNSSTTPTSTTTISTGTTQRPTDTTAVSLVPPVIVCPTVPCPLESVCLNGTCQCLSGSFLVNGRCAAAQVFPGQLHLTSLTFKKDMSNRASVIFQNTAAQISASLRDALKNQPGYKQSDVVQLEPGSVRATVNNIFENTTATQESVDRAINKAIANPANGLLANATFTGTNLCAQEPLPCDVSTTMCTLSNGQAVCSCREGYISILYSNTSCRVCPSGQRAVGDVCQSCAFGYAGFNCNDSALLAVVIISCVLGVLLIIVLALLIYCSWRGCARSKPDYSSSPYSSGDLNQPWPTGVTPIPRASTNWEAAPPIEMSEGGSTRILMDKNHQTNGSGSYDLNPEGMNTFKDKNPSRYSYLVQGHENPYFLPADGKNN